MPLYDDLEQRALIAQSTSPAVRAALNTQKLTAYIGFDPTAPSLHIGGFLPVTMLMRLQRAGHRPIALVGGGTGLIGDPSGRESERSMLSLDVLEQNVAALRSQLERFLDFGGDRGALLVNNAEWLGKLDLLGFLRDIGKHFSVNAMIARDSVKMRLEAREQGISFTEFSYMLLQSYDYLALFDRFGCSLQMGGSDQWGNIVSGTDLVRRLRGAETHGLTFPLITRADGKKFGKSEQGNVWLSDKLTTPYDFYQFWLNTADTDVIRYLKFFTFLSLEEIADIERKLVEAPQAREAQRILARTMTEMVHSKEATLRIEQTSAVLFDETADWRALSPDQLTEAFASSPSTTVDRDRLGTPAAELSLLLSEAGLCQSKTQARRAIQEGGVYVNGKKITDIAARIAEPDLLAGTFVVLRRGKKTFHVLRFGAPVS
ncbi:MAG: tyrosine--tRNA ligase [Polyangiaceae bacterium]|nr:tyrosine--tRNA ligase [Polyangiaceae bacterium]NUQ76449.1 tyrosine--tRNA ligase [Polyangiaceae bacterium]